MAIEKKKRITVRFSSDDARQVSEKAAAAGLAKSTYIREVALGKMPQDEADFSVYDHTAALQNLRGELLKIGTNINQMTRVANTAGSIHGERLGQIKKELAVVNEKILDALL